MTDREWNLYRPYAEKWKKLYGVNEPRNILVSMGLRNLERDAAVLLLPHQFARWEQEWLDQLARPYLYQDSRLDAQARSHPLAEGLLSRKLRAEIRARESWQARKARFERVRSLTGSKDQWSLLHPFDALTTKEMDELVNAITRAKRQGLQSLSKGEWLVLLVTGNRAFFSQMLEDAKKDYQSK